MFPHCFPSEQQYREWVGYAKIVAEPVHICEDCTKDFQREMLLEEFAALVEEKATAIEREWLIEYIQEHQPSCKQMIKAIDVRGQA